MNTLSINSSRPLVTRFAWKEYRMLRGLWLASFLIGLFVQVVPHLLWTGTLRTDPAGGFFVAWVAAALYAVGAAITMFCAETEERTRDYLRLLPGNTTPIIATKLVMALSTAVALGCALSLTSWFLANYTWANPRHAEQALALGGVGVVEGLAWGLLFSLWWKQPLLAAVAAIACASLGTQVAILGTTEAKDAFSLEAYQAAVPGRLLICLAVLSLDVLLASQWLYPRRKHERISRRAIAVELPASNTHARVRTAAWPRTKMFTRLLWQTWRESWKTLLAAIAISAVLTTALILPAYIHSPHDFIKALPFVSLIPPALLGALAFRADQQRDHRLFLATHAAKPRYVWLARHAIWLGVVLLLGIVIHRAGWWLMLTVLRQEIAHYFEGRWSYYPEWLGREFSTGDSKHVQAWRFEYMQATYTRGVLAVWSAFIAAYGVGQLCSMLLKQSLLSGFLAILLAFVLVAWSVLMYLWEMSALGFILPIGIAALLATWLRAPSWILGKNHWRHWVAPALALFAPLAVMLGMIPSTRMAQLDKFTRQKISLFDKPFANQDELYKATKNRMGETALAYERLLAEIHEYYDKIRQSAVTPKDAPLETLQELAERLIEITKRPFSKFPVRDVVNPGSYMFLAQRLLTQDAHLLQLEGELDLSFERLAAKLRLLAHSLSNQGSLQFTSLLDRDDNESFGETCAAILDWAQAKGQTSDRLVAAIGTLQEVFAELPQPADTIYADRERIRQIILENEPPSIQNHLITGLNRLPGEQARALRALDILAAMTKEYIFQTQRLINATEYSIESVEAATQLRNDLSTVPWTNMFAIHPVMNELHPEGYRGVNQLAEACATSFLVTEELERSGNLRSLLNNWTEFVAQSRALSVQLALLAYRLDHDKYPDTLAELVPDYLPRMINDPYSGKPFEYRPEGLDLPLIRSNRFEGGILPSIPAGTPLLWSVDLSGNHLQEFRALVRDGETIDYKSAGSYGGEFGPMNNQTEEDEWLTFYRFQPDAGYGSSANFLVFPLPKIENSQETETDQSEAP